MRSAIAIRLLCRCADKSEREFAQRGNRPFVAYIGSSRAPRVRCRAASTYVATITSLLHTRCSTREQAINLLGDGDA